jgi:hypothetical protein
MRHKFIQKITAYGVQLRQGYWCLKRQFQQYLSDIVAISFIGGENRCKSPTCSKPCQVKLVSYSFPEADSRYTGFKTAIESVYDLFYNIRMNSRPNIVCEFVYGHE